MAKLVYFIVMRKFFWFKLLTDNTKDWLLIVNDQWSMVNDQWLMVNDQWLILQHWRGGLQALLVKGFFYILEGDLSCSGKGELTLLLEGELPHILRLFADFAPTHVWHNTGIRYSLVTFFTLRSSLFTFHHIPKLIRLATFFILHSLYHCSSSERGILRGGWRHSTEPVRASGASSWGLVPSLR